MKAVQCPHDRFFRRTMGYPVIARDFLVNYLPQGILNIVDLRHLVLEEASFIPPSLQETSADLLFRTEFFGQEGYVYFLFEHKSSPDQYVAHQLNGYLHEVRRRAREEGMVPPSSPFLPRVVPLVMYHGTAMWTASNRYEDLVEPGEEMRIITPHWQYLLYDLSQYNDSMIKGKPLLTMFLRILRDRAKPFPFTLLPFLESIVVTLKSEGTELDLFSTVVRYLMEVRRDVTPDVWMQVTQKRYPERSEDVMTVAAKLREEGFLVGTEFGIKQGLGRGLEQGLEQGLEKGAVAELRSLLLELLADRFGFVEPAIQEKIKTTERTVLRMAVKHLSGFRTVEDVWNYLS